MAVKRYFRSFNGKVRKSRGTTPLSMMLSPEKVKQLKKKRRDYEKMVDKIIAESRKKVGM